MKMMFKKNKKGVLCALAVLLAVLFTAANMSVYAAGNNPVYITVKQIFAVLPESAAPADNSFTYRLKPLESNNPMPENSTAEGYTFTVAGNGSAQIGPIRYIRQGIYQYELFQVGMRTENSYYTYDARIYKIEVYVYSGQDANIIVSNEKGEKALDIEFKNYYVIPGINTPETTTDPTTEPSTEPSTEPPTTTEAPTTTKSNPDPTTDPTTTEKEKSSSPPEIITTPVTEQPATEPTIELTTERPHDLSPRPTEDQPYEPDGTLPKLPPNPAVPGNKLIPDDDGYVEVDDEGNPTGRWVWDDDAGEWVFIPYPPNNTINTVPVFSGSPDDINTEPPKTPPKTGDDSNTPLYIALLVLAALIAVSAMIYLFIDGKSKEEKEE